MVESCLSSSFDEDTNVTWIPLIGGVVVTKEINFYYSKQIYLHKIQIYFPLSQFLVTTSYTLTIHSLHISTLVHTNSHTFLSFLTLSFSSYHKYMKPYYRLKNHLINCHLSHFMFILFIYG